MERFQGRELDKYIDKETFEYPLFAFDIISRYPLTGFPEPFAPLPRYALVPESTPPAFDAQSHKAVEVDPAQDGENFVQVWSVQPLTQDELDQRAADHVATEKASRDAARITISRTQGLIYLYRTLAVKESDIDAMLAGHEDEDTRYEAGLYFRAGVWESDNPFVLMLCQRVGLDTPEKLQAAFSAAKLI